MSNPNNWQKIFLICLLLMTVTSVVKAQIKDISNSKNGIMVTKNIRFGLPTIIINILSPMEIRLS